MDGYTDKQIGWMDGWAGEEMNGQMDEWTVRLMHLLYRSTTGNRVADKHVVSISRLVRTACDSFSLLTNQYKSSKTGACGFFHYVGGG